ncbi:MAG: M23 family metallopeptidase [Treponemataceae bacterium]|nr:MAG: M23 family metallopeptidase [Treponemataceae bacterium]
MNRKLKRIFRVMLLVLLFPHVRSLTAQSASNRDAVNRNASNQNVFYPQIKTLGVTDPLFSQYMQDVESAYKTIAAIDHGRSSAADFIPIFYSYTAAKDDTVFTVAARCSIPYDTLATVNRLSSSSAAISGSTLILPAAPGLFVTYEPDSPLEILLSRRYEIIEHAKIGQHYVVNGEALWYDCSAKFSGEERSFFLDKDLVMPLSRSVLTSAYGRRASPFTGAWQFHKGVDLAAPTGTPIFACKAGTVEYTGYDAVYGNHVIIAHSGNMKTLYAHLSKIDVKSAQQVRGGETIGKVGTTGAATGPHLHLEVRVNGNLQNPQELLKKTKSPI